MFAPRSHDRLFPCEFGFAVHAQRGGGILLPERSVSHAAEHVVGRDVKQRGVARFGGFGQVPHGFAVDPVGRFDLFFRLIYIGVGGTIDDRVDPLVFDEPSYGVRIGDVQVGDVGKEIAVPRSCAERAHFAAQLSVGTGYEYVMHSSRFHSRKVLRHL